ncbi:MAG: calcium/sodium antiporter [Clostridia bacterium]|nr:calcium/sodium antiporter [Clostridia bacterium]
MFFYLVLLIAGLYLLIRGADIFVDGSVEIARKFNISEMLIGMTLVCFGTSLPELIVSINGSLKDTADLVIGNMVGSNIFNICIILGLVSVINPVKLVKETVRKDMYMSLVTGLAFLFVTLDTLNSALQGNVISRADGGILLILFAIFMYYTLYEFGGLTAKTREKRELRKQHKSEYKRIKKEKRQLIDVKELIKNILICLLGGMLVFVGSECVINGAVGFATVIGVSETFIAILVIAVGTSLPELATSLAALKKKKVNVAVGNLIGSNMYNMLFITGTAAVINPLRVSSYAIWIDIAVFILITLILILFTKIRYIRKGSYELSRVEGIILIVVYIAYISYVIYRG